MLRQQDKVSKLQAELEQSVCKPVPADVDDSKDEEAVLERRLAVLRRARTASVHCSCNELSQRDFQPARNHYTQRNAACNASRGRLVW